MLVTFFQAFSTVLIRVGRYFKSPFDPLDLRDMQLRQKISRVMVNDAAWWTFCVFVDANPGEPRKKTLLLSMKCWSFNRDPCNGVL